MRCHTNDLSVLLLLGRIDVVVIKADTVDGAQSDQQQSQAIGYLTGEAMALVNLEVDNMVINKFIPINLD